MKVQFLLYSTIKFAFLQIKIMETEDKNNIGESPWKR